MVDKFLSGVKEFHFDLFRSRCWSRRTRWAWPSVVSVISHREMEIYVILPCMACEGQKQNTDDLPGRFSVYRAESIIRAVLGEPELTFFSSSLSEWCYQDRWIHAMLLNLLSLGSESPWCAFTRISSTVEIACHQATCHQVCHQTHHVRAVWPEVGPCGWDIGLPRVGLLERGSLARKVNTAQTLWNDESGTLPVLLTPTAPSVLWYQSATGNQSHSS